MRHKKASCRKRITRQHFVSQNFVQGWDMVDPVKRSSHLVWSPRKNRLPCVIQFVGDPPKWEPWAPLPLDGGVADPVETCPSPTYVTTPNLVAPGQTVWA